MNQIKTTGFLYGGDYYPEQWLSYPEIIHEDIRLMKLAGYNTVTLGVFAWSRLEPEEGQFQFEWLDDIMEQLANAGMNIILSTPSAGKPQWLMHQYPEVMRVTSDRTRISPGDRVNHCLTSPVFREKVKIINTKLAKRYKDHPSLILWHVSNEIIYDCHCNLCQEAFRSWLKKQYGSLSELNKVYWGDFWSHNYTDWSQMTSPNPNGEYRLHGLNLDWKRFSTDQLIQYLQNEMIPLKEWTPHIPVTTNFVTGDMTFNQGKMTDILDYVALDVYPNWRPDLNNKDIAIGNSFIYDIARTQKGHKPFLVMEFSPSVIYWMPENPLKRPGLNTLETFQSVAHGSDSVLYFQWRKGRGGCEKLMGAVLDHNGSEHTRVFREIAQTGKMLSEIKEVMGTTKIAETAILFDWENAWGIQDACGPREDKAYLTTCLEHYQYFWQAGIPVDVINEGSELSAYKLVIAPMLYMVKPQVAQKIDQFVKKGGIFITTYFSGIVDQNDLCFTNGFPGPLREIVGVWSEEMDALPKEMTNTIIMAPDNALGIQKSSSCGFFCDLVQIETADVLARYGKDFYAGRPALTVNQYGQGKAYYMATRHETKFLAAFYEKIIQDAGISKVTDMQIPEGILVQERLSMTHQYLFILNFSGTNKVLEMGESHMTDVYSGLAVSGSIEIETNGVRILRRKM